MKTVVGLGVQDMSKYIKEKGEQAMPRKRERQDIIPYLHAFQNCKTCDKCICDQKFESFNCTWCEFFRDIFYDVREKLDNYMSKIM